MMGEIQESDETPLELTMNQLIDYLTGQDEISMACMKDDPKLELARRLKVAEHNVGVYGAMREAFRKSEFSEIHGELTTERAIVLNMVLQYLNAARQYAALHGMYIPLYQEHEKLKVQIAEDKILSAKSLVEERERAGKIEEERDQLRAQLQRSWRHKLAAWLLGVK